MPQRRLSRAVQFASAIALSMISLVGISTPAQATPCPTLSSQITSSTTYALCDFTGWDFHGLSRTNVDFGISYLAGANFAGATFTNTQMGNNASHNIIFTGANMTGFNNLAGVALVDLSGSNLTDANFTNANFHFTHLTGANMTNVNLTGANLDNAFLGDADLTGATVTQSQLAIAVLNENTICPDGYRLGLHTGDCFSPLTPLVPVLSTPVITSGGFTFSVDNYNEEYTYTLQVISGTAVPTMESPSGTKLPITVTGVPTGTSAVVGVTATIGSVSAQATATNALPNTGAPKPQLPLTISLLAIISLSAGIILVTRARRSVSVQS